MLQVGSSLWHGCQSEHLLGTLNLLPVRQRKDLRVVALRDLIEGLCQDPADCESHHYRHSYEDACSKVDDLTPALKGSWSLLKH